MKLRQHCHLTLLQRMYREAPRSSNSSQRHGTRMPTERKLCAPSSRCTTTTYRHTIQSSLMAMSDRRCAPSSSPCRRQTSCRLIEEYFSELCAPSSRCTTTTIPPYYTIVSDGQARSTVRTKLEPLSKAVKLQDRWSPFLVHQVFEDIHSTMERCSLR